MPIPETTLRNFDFFRLSHGKEMVDVAPAQLRKWATRDGGPKIYRMNDDDMVWMRFSEIEAFIIANSREQKIAA